MDFGSILVDFGHFWAFFVHFWAIFGVFLHIWGGREGFSPNSGNLPAIWTIILTISHKIPQNHPKMLKISTKSLPKCIYGGIRVILDGNVFILDDFRWFWVNYVQIWANMGDFGLIFTPKSHIWGNMGVFGRNFTNFTPNVAKYHSKSLEITQILPKCNPISQIWGECAQFGRNFSIFYHF